MYGCLRPPGGHGDDVSCTAGRVLDLESQEAFLSIVFSRPVSTHALWAALCLDDHCLD